MRAVIFSAFIIVAFFIAHAQQASAPGTFTATGPCPSLAGFSALQVVDADFKKCRIAEVVPVRIRQQYDVTIECEKNQMHFAHVTVSYDDLLNCKVQSVEFVN